jgi:hypothetical protein
MTSSVHGFGFYRVQNMVGNLSLRAGMAGASAPACPRGGGGGFGLQPGQRGMIMCCRGVYTASGLALHALQQDAAWQPHTCVTRSNQPGPNTDVSLTPPRAQASLV